jgi:chorismate mutase
MRGIRGAITVNKNEREEILAAVSELLSALIENNHIITEDIGAVIFSSTPDLDAVFPAVAARNLGWVDVPLFGTQEIDNPQGLGNCIRVLILLNTEKTQKEIKHIYLRGAQVLRQDIVKK